MIAYFAAIPVLLYPTLCHKMVISRGKDAVLFIHEKALKNKELLYVLEELKEKEIFKDVVACNMIIVSSGDVSMEEGERKIVDSFDKIFEESRYDILSFEKIYSMNDSWDGEQNVYFNVRHIPYTWIQIGKNYIAKPASTLHGGCYAALMTKYQAATPFAEYADACLFDSSEVTKKQLNDKSKSYTLWDRDQCFNEITEEEMDRLFAVFHLAENNIAYTNAYESVMVIKNSFGYLNMYTDVRNPLLYFGSYSKSEIFSVMDKVSMDFYAHEAKELYIKHHIHNYVDTAETKRLYGGNAVSLPNVPFEIMGRYFNRNNIKFDKIIGTTSTSLAAINTENYNCYYPLGIDFAKTWWFYISIYVSLLFAREQGLKQIFCDNVLKTQLELLADEMEYGIDTCIIKTKEIDKIKNSLIICDLGGGKRIFCSAGG